MGDAAEMALDSWPVPDDARASFENTWRLPYEVWNHLAQAQIWLVELERVRPDLADSATVARLFEEMDAFMRHLAAARTA